MGSEKVAKEDIMQEAQSKLGIQNRIKEEVFASDGESVPFMISLHIVESTSITCVAVGKYTTQDTPSGCSEWTVHSKLTTAVRFIS